MHAPISIYGEHCKMQDTYRIAGNYGEVFNLAIW